MFFGVEHLTKHFGELVAVDDLSFEVKERDIFGIAGPNGAGKTTLFNLISGVYHGTGRIIFQDEVISRLRPHEVCHKGIARTFQAPIIFPTMSVLENIDVGARFGAPRRRTQRTVREIISYLNLEDRKYLPAKHLSLFDKKLTMIGAALATNPRLLLLDEPLGGLSPREIDQMVSLFRRINEDFGLTIIIIEHLMKYLIKVSNSLMILHSGRKIYVGRPEEVSNDNQVMEVYLGRDVTYA